MGKNRSKNMEKLVEFFRDHVGQDNGVAASEIYSLIYPEDKGQDRFAVSMRWRNIRRLMTTMRKKTNVFVVSEKIGDTFFYYTLSNENESRKFNNRLQKLVDGIKDTQLKCEAYVSSNLAMIPISTKKKKLGAPND